MTTKEEFIAKVEAAKAAGKEVPEWAIKAIENWDKPVEAKQDRRTSRQRIIAKRFATGYCKSMR